MPQGMGALNDPMGIELVEISAERVVATMPVEGNTQPYGLLHGGASVVLAETLGSVGSATPRLSGPAVGRRGHQRHPPPLGDVRHRHRCRTAIHLGRSMATYEVVITDERGKRVCTSRITCALMPAERYR